MPCNVSNGWLAGFHQLLVEEQMGLSSTTLEMISKWVYCTLSTSVILTAKRCILSKHNGIKVQIHQWLLTGSSKWDTSTTNGETEFVYLVFRKEFGSFRPCGHSFLVEDLLGWSGLPLCSFTVDWRNINNSYLNRLFGLDKQIARESLVLMDVGCELHGYVSDMTRTWPPCGYFTAAQVVHPLRSFILACPM